MIWDGVREKRGLEYGVTIDGIDVLLVGRIAFVTSMVIAPVSRIFGSIAFVKDMAGLDEPVAKGDI